MGDIYILYFSSDALQLKIDSDSEMLDNILFKINKIIFKLKKGNNNFYFHF